MFLCQALFLASVLSCGLSGGFGSGFHGKKNIAHQYSQPISYEQPQPFVAPQPIPYSFEYDAEGSSRQESSDGSGRVIGRYTVTNEDGSVRVVNYVADDQGFRADIDTDEPGTKSDNPANVELKSAFKEPEAPQTYGYQHDKVNRFAQATHHSAEPIKQSAFQPQQPVGSYSLGKINLQQDIAYDSSPQLSQAQEDVPYTEPQLLSQRQEDTSYGAAQFSQRKEPVSYAAEQSAPQYSSDSYSPYAFNYFAQLEDGSSSRSESSDASGKVQGSYSLSVDDGRQRTVEYTADENGFYAKVITNEAGTKSESPADVQLYSSAIEAEPEPQRYASGSASVKTIGYSGQASIKSASALHQPSFKSKMSLPFASKPSQPIVQQRPAFVQQKQVEQQHGFRPSPYAFSYDSEDGSQRSESSDEYGAVKGFYTVQNPDGTKRIVKYTADENGFHADVQTDEHGTKSENPADVIFKSSAIDAPARTSPVQMRQKLKQKAESHLLEQKRVQPQFEQKKVSPTRFEQTQVPPRFEQTKVQQHFEQRKVSPTRFEQTKVPPQFEQTKIQPQFEQTKVHQKFEQTKIPPQFEQTKVHQKFEQTKIPPNVEQWKVEPQFEQRPSVHTFSQKSIKQ